MLPEILFGHIAGDYFFQNKEMALKKSSNSAICTVHCSIYTLWMWMITQNHSLKWLAFIFITHFIVDRWSLAEHWLKFIDGRTLKGFLKSEIPPEIDVDKRMNYNILSGGFAAIVYTVVDNGIHLMLAYYSIKYF